MTAPPPPDLSPVRGEERERTHMGNSGYSRRDWVE